MTTTKTTITTLLVLVLSACAETPRHSWRMAQAEHRCPANTVKVCSDGLEPCGCAQLVNVY